MAYSSAAVQLLFFAFLALFAIHHAAADACIAEMGVCEPGGDAACCDGMSCVATDDGGYECAMADGGGDDDIEEPDSIEVTQTVTDEPGDEEDEVIDETTETGGDEEDGGTDDPADDAGDEEDDGGDGAEYEEYYDDAGDNGDGTGDEEDDGGDDIEVTAAGADDGDDEEKIDKIPEPIPAPVEEPAEPSIVTEPEPEPELMGGYGDVEERTRRPRGARPTDPPRVREPRPIDPPRERGGYGKE